uniref:Insulin receptor substrate 1 n=2 Tax=Clastoptera arizonana TaxID=38151 RepID=A0A1B6CBS7_9HEMI
MSSVIWPFAGSEGVGKDTSKLVPADVVKMGYLRKLKTMKKKYFVLRADSPEASARLEYYDSLQKWKTNKNPKRSIILKNCFNINKRSDIRQKFVIALYTKNDCFCLVLDSEEDLDEWLKSLLSLQHGEDIPDGELPKPIFEHVWEVSVLKKDLGSSKNILGPHLLCLTDRTLSLVKKTSNEKSDRIIEFSLQSIRLCGHLESFFYLEVGQASVTGQGNLWMQTEDSNIAINMHEAILSACSNCTKKELPPKLRNRSSSANEASKPILVMQKSSTQAEEVVHSGHSENPCSVTSLATVSECTNHEHTGLTGGRERCDSLPTRPRTTSEGAHHLPHPPRLSNSVISNNSTRPNSMYIPGISPPVPPSPISPPSGTCSTDSASSSLSMDGDGMGENSWNRDVDSNRHGHSLTPDEPVILEENYDDYAPWQAGVDNDYLQMEPSFCQMIHSTHSFINRKYSPNLSSSGFKSSTSPSQGSGMDLYSPSDGASPSETPNAYMSMSPGDTRNTLYGRISTNHSRGSSLAETEEGYVPMAPGDDGYVDMDHGNNGSQPVKHSHDHYRSGDLSPGCSSCSITSGTPSTDTRFSEYPLEKVSAYIKPGQDDITPEERPTRAYSVGSRPVNNNNNIVSDINHPETHQRVRAFSVGSRYPKARPILHPHSHLIPSSRPPSSSHSSVDGQNDLMLLDFTKNNKSSRNKKSTALKKTPVLSSSELTLPSSAVSSAASSYSTAEGSYMDSPRSSPKLLDSDCTSQELSPPKSFRGSGFIGRSPPKSLSSYIDVKSSNHYLSSSPPMTGYPSPPLYRVPESDVNYPELPIIRGENSTNNSPSNTLSSSPKIVVGRSQSPAKDGYMEMKPAKQVLPKSTQPRVETFPVSASSKNHNIPVISTPLIKQPLFTTNYLTRSKQPQVQEDYMDMNLKRKIPVVEDNNNSKILVGRTAPLDTPKVPEGYVEMSWTKKPARKSSLDSVNAADAYLNMSVGSSIPRRERRGSKKDRNRCSSQPITIQSCNKDGTISTSPVYTYVGRKHSTGTPPKNPSFLPVNSYGSSSSSSSLFSSLGRNRNRKTPRRDSKDFNSGLSTPTGSSTTIFPFSLNSPGSPIKPFAQESHKCSVDVTSGTVQISESPEKNTPSLTNKCNLPDTREYVNYDPNSSKDKVLDQDYTEMLPISSIDVEKTEKLSEVNNSSKAVGSIIAGVSDITLNTPAQSMSDTKSDECTRLSESEVSSRNCEKKVLRTPSVSSVGEKELHYASLDLVRSGSEGDDSGQNQARNLKSQSSLTESSSTSTPSPNVSTDSAFNYAEIDFSKCAASKKKHH